MRRTLLAVAVLAPMLAAAYACSTDTFTDGDAATDGARDGGPVTKEEFCAAESQYFGSCPGGDAACVKVDLQNCGQLYSDFTNGFATALAHCMEKGNLQCNTELGKAIISSCVNGELAGYSNDSGVLATFANDFCAKCAPSSTTCAGKFGQSDQPGYLPSMFNDQIIQSMDTCVKAIDASAFPKDDAGPCLNASLACEYIALAIAGPAEACNDN